MTAVATILAFHAHPDDEEPALFDADAAVGVHHGASDPARAVRGQEPVAARIVLTGERDLQGRAAAQVFLGRAFVTCRSQSRQD